ILVCVAVGGVGLLRPALRRGWRGPGARPADSARVMAGCGVALGVTAFVAYVCQNVGLQHTTTSTSAFITGLFAVFTPLVAAVVYRRLPNSSVGLSVVP